jgi:hypothetical protein
LKEDCLLLNRFDNCRRKSVYSLKIFIGMTPEYFAKDNYGTMPLIQSEEQLDRPFISINDINETLIKQIIWIRGCVQATCKRGKQCLFVIRHQSETVQAFICDNEYVSKLMVQFVTK